MPLKLYGFIPRRHTASFHYRIEIPFLSARDLGLKVEPHIDTDDSSIPRELKIAAFCESDVAVVYQPVGEGPLQNHRALQRFIPSKRDGAWKWPPTIVVDSDDNLFDISPLNPAYRHLGMRDGQGNDVPDGHRIGTVKDGVREVMYEDGKEGFSIAENRHRLSTYRAMLNLADCVTCSTAEVEAYVKREATPFRTRVFPNLVRLDHFEQLTLPYSKKVKVLWQGGQNHYEDLAPLRKSFGRLTKKHPEVQWIFWGALYPWVTETIPPDRFKFLDWCPYHEYKLRLVMVGHDINLAPLSESRFNRCRTAIKFYESSVLAKPVATLAQRTGPYAAEIQDGETGMLFSDPDEFEQKFSALVEDEKLRRVLGWNARDWVSEHRDALKETPKLISFYEELREEKKREQPRVTDEQFAEIEAEVERMEKEAAEREAEAIEKGDGDAALRVE